MTEVMGEKDGHLRKQTAASLIRMTPKEREFLLEAARKKSAELSAVAPGNKMGLTQLIKSGAILWAEKILGRSFFKDD